jgi:excisionase family DNA binding protein
MPLMPKDERPTQELMARPTRDAKMAKQGCISVREAAARLKVSDKRVYALATSGVLKLRRFGGAVYVIVESVEAYEKATTVRPGLISIADANVKYGFSRATLFRYMRQGLLHPVHIKRLLYFEKTELDWQLLGKDKATNDDGTPPAPKPEQAKKKAPARTNAKKNR